MEFCFGTLKYVEGNGDIFQKIKAMVKLYNKRMVRYFTV